MGARTVPSEAGRRVASMMAEKAAETGAPGLGMGGGPGGVARRLAVREVAVLRKGAVEVEHEGT